MHSTCSSACVESGQIWTHAIGGRHSQGRAPVCASYPGIVWTQKNLELDWQTSSPYVHWWCLWGGRSFRYSWGCACWLLWAQVSLFRWRCSCFFGLTSGVHLVSARWLVKLKFPQSSLWRRPGTMSLLSDPCCGLWTTALRRLALVRSFSPVFDNYELLSINATLDVGLQSLNWYSRVPSKSNPGDAPSRLEFSDLDGQGYEGVSPCRAIERCFAESPFVQKKKGVSFSSICHEWFHVLHVSLSRCLFATCLRRLICIYIFGDMYIYIYI